MVKPRGRIPALLFLAGVACGGCEDPEQVGMFVDLKTDLRPGSDFAVAQVRVFVGLPDEDAEPIRDLSDSVATVDDFLDGQRIADVEGLTPGDYYVEVTLTDETEAFVARRTIVVELVETLAVVVLVTRDCQSVMCPTATDAPEAISCLNGVCVDPSCVGDACGPQACDGPADCTSAASCVTATCDEGACFYRFDDGECVPGDICDIDRGCIIPPDVCTPAAETCNGVDDDCNRSIDDAVGICEPIGGCEVDRMDDRPYIFCDFRRAFSDAQNLCSDHGYHMVVVDDAAEQTFLEDAADLRAPTEWWVGLRDADGNGRYEDDEWVVGMSSFRAWDSGQPNLDDGCAFLDSDDGGGRWGDARCFLGRHVICEPPAE